MEWRVLSLCIKVDIEKTVQIYNLARNSGCLEGKERRRRRQKLATGLAALDCRHGLTCMPKAAEIVLVSSPICYSSERAKRRRLRLCRRIRRSPPLLVSSPVPEGEGNQTYGGWSVDYYPFS
jgi:hypothetical protein